MAYDFKSSLERGKKGEEAFLALWPELIRTDGRAGDFITPDGQIVELKTDGYDMNKTSNFFIEFLSDVTKMKVGGPWQAREHGADIFVYMFSVNKTAFVFDTTKLLIELQPIIKTLAQIEIKNVRWTTVGYKVPRSLLTPERILKA